MSANSVNRKREEVRIDDVRLSFIFLIVLQLVFPVDWMRQVSRGGGA
jgi:hypothetical protein